MHRLVRLLTNDNSQLHMIAKTGKESRRFLPTAASSHVKGSRNYNNSMSSAHRLRKAKKFLYLTANVLLFSPT